MPKPTQSARLDAPTSTAAAPGAGRRTQLIALVQSRGAIAMLVVVALVAGMVFPDFLRPANLADIVSNGAFLGLVAVGQSIVIILGGFDLSVGSMVGLGTVLTAYAAPYGWGAAMLAPVAAGFVVGLGNGLLIARARMAPFIVTLAALLGLKGLALVLASQDLLIANPGFFARIANGSILGVNNLIWMLIVVYALGAALLNHTRFGAAIFAIGGNEEAARMLGVRVERVKVLAYGLSGALAGLSGALLASHLDSGLSGAGTGYELQSIAAAVIGGVLLTGGVGTMAGPLAGVLLLGVIDNVINQVGTLSPYYQNLASGAFLLAAVIVQTVLTGRRQGAARAAGATRRRVAADGAARS
ncbi:monosaccharide ABC transporter membrane protein (CUT2 family) [Paraburkholderia unamae]|uniref:ABC transporter permease n=1 Tax=Paraburkholderia unamae TaxID=219649 RepID=UPI000DC4DAE9|nr:ABC transporter permease [Paraburkholderia unamae]RAR47659.1 monosaccharide ABC transporter membrane protein (CUT2 family) [Paraburkholderia unamae]